MATFQCPQADTKVGIRYFSPPLILNNSHIDAPPTCKKSYYLHENEDPKFLIKKYINRSIGK